MKKIVRLKELLYTCLGIQHEIDNFLLYCKMQRAFPLDKENSPSHYAYRFITLSASLYGLLFNYEGEHYLSSRRTRARACCLISIENILTLFLQYTTQKHTVRGTSNKTKF